MAVRFSVIILTCNRAALLADCLEALVRQSVPPFEVIVVDNGSTDATPAVLARFGCLDVSEGEADGNVESPKPQDGTGSGFLLRRIAGDPALGWAAARNLGVQAARGDWVVFTDDDCLPPCDWLEKLKNQVETGRWDAVGGLAVAPGGMRFPRWWHPDLAWAVGLSSTPDEKSDTRWDATVYPTTSNWASQRDMLLAEPFQEIPEAFLDQSAEGQARLYAGGREDAELWRRLRQRGYRCLLDPAWTVTHRVGLDRLEFRRILKRAYQDGIALQRREPKDGLLPSAVDTLVSLPGALLLAALKNPADFRREAARLGVWAARQAGQCRQALRRLGWGRGTGYLAWLACRSALLQGTGFLKRGARRGGIALLRCFHPVQPSPLIKRMGKGPEAAFEETVVVGGAGYLGDLVLLRSLIAGLRRKRPKARVILVTTPAGEELYRGDPETPELVVVGRTAGSVRADTQAIQSAVGKVPRVVFLVAYFHKAHPSLVYCLKQARVVTLSDEVGFPRQWYYDRADQLITKRADRHEIENLARLFAEAGFEGEIPHVPLHLSEGERQEMARALETRGLAPRGYVVLAPGTGQPGKFWLEERWAELARRIGTELGWPVLLTGPESEAGLLNRIREQAPDCQIWTCGLRELGTLLERARLLVCCDNGAKHLAVAVGTPSLALFGPTDERQWGACRQTERHPVVRGCGADLFWEERVGLPLNHEMGCLSVSQVWDALIALVRTVSP
ncbi:MAG TPA: glycosyltransferase [Candidatus Sumerlaeota bacterium]|nr:glycosyltransferase [Candidatus Sumerlaeota bacterium]